jgi:hypothetical protein
MSSVWAHKILVSSTDGVVNVGTALDGASTTITASTYSVPIMTHKWDRIGLVLAAAAGSTLVGALAMQGSSDVSQNEGKGSATESDANLLNWAPLSFLDQSTGQVIQTKNINTGAFALGFVLDDFGFRWYRIQFTFTSGSGLLIAKVSLKSI